MVIILSGSVFFLVTTGTPTEKASKYVLEKPSSWDVFNKQNELERNENISFLSRLPTNLTFTEALEELTMKLPMTVKNQPLAMMGGENLLKTFLSLMRSYTWALLIR